MTINDLSMRYPYSLMILALITSTLFSRCQSGSQLKSQLILDTTLSRSLVIYLPPGYLPTENYKTLYFLDGQNIFTDSTSFVGEWHVDELLDSLIKSNIIEPVIAVAIYNSPRRAEEYSPYFDSAFIRFFNMDSWDAEIMPAHARFIRDSVFTHISKTYGASMDGKKRAIFGSSLGGLHTFWWAIHTPAEIGMAAMMSPSLWVGGGAALNDLHTEAQLDTSLIWWVDIGTNEWETKLPLFYQQLQQKGLEPDKNLYLLEDANAYHNEKAWSERVGNPIVLFAGKAKPEFASSDVKILTCQFAYTDFPIKYQRLVVEKTEKLTGIRQTRYPENVTFTNDWAIGTQGEIVPVPNTSSILTFELDQQFFEVRLTDANGIITILTDENN